MNKLFGTEKMLSIYLKFRNLVVSQGLNFLTPVGEKYN